MSFGLSLGDVASTSQIAWNLCKRIEGSPNDFKDLAANVANLQIALKETEDYYRDQELLLQHRNQLAAADQDCRSVLDFIEKRLEKSEGLGTKSQRAWDRVRWGMEDASALRDRLVSSITALTALNASLANTLQARIEKRLNQLLAEVKEGKRERSLVSISTLQSFSAHDKDVWNDFKRDFEDVGIDKELFTQNRKFIADWFQKAVEPVGLDAEVVGDRTATVKSLSTLVESDLDLLPVLSKTSSVKAERNVLETLASLDSEPKHLSISQTQTSSNASHGTIPSPHREDFPKFLEQERSQESPKRTSIFRRMSLKRIGTRLPFRKDGLDSPLRSPLSPRSINRSARASFVEPASASFPVLPPPPLPPSAVEPGPSQWMQARNRSNTSRTMVTRLSDMGDMGGEVDIASGYSPSFEEVMAKIPASKPVRPQSESISNQKSSIVDKRSSASKVVTALPQKRTSTDIYTPTLLGRTRGESESISTRRPSEPCSEVSTKHSSRTSTALSPYERETLERHNAIMTKLYPVRTPEQDALLEQARRSLQIGTPKSFSRPPLQPFVRPAASGMEMQAPMPPPKDEKHLRRHTQPVTPTSIRELASMPSSSSLATSGSDFLTVMFLPEFNAPPPIDSEIPSHQDDYDTDPGGEDAVYVVDDEERMINELKDYMVELKSAKKRAAFINETDGNGETYLLTAATKGFAKAVLYLLQNGAEVLVRNDKGQDALHAAVAANQPEAVQAVLDSIPANSITALWKSNVLHTAVELGSYEMVEALLENGADINARDDAGRTVFQVAELNEDEGMMRQLLDHSAHMASMGTDEVEEHGKKLL